MGPSASLFVHVLVRYDGEPFEPAWIAQRVRDFLEGRPVDLQVAEHEAREMAYHHIRIHMHDRARPKLGSRSPEPRNRATRKRWQ